MARSPYIYVVYRQVGPERSSQDLSIGHFTVKYESENAACRYADSPLPPNTYGLYRKRFADGITEGTDCPWDDDTLYDLWEPDDRNQNCQHKLLLVSFEMSLTQQPEPMVTYETAIGAVGTVIREGRWNESRCQKGLLVEVLASDNGETCFKFPHEDRVYYVPSHYIKRKED